MQIFLIVFLSILYIWLSFFIFYKKRQVQENMVKFSKRFLIHVLLLLFITSLTLIIPEFYLKGLNPWAFILLMLVKVVLIISIIWYKNFYIIYEEEFFTYSNLLAKTFKIYYKEVVEIDAKGDTIIIEANNKTFYVMNHKGYVPQAKKFVEIVKERRH